MSSENPMSSPMPWDLVSEGYVSENKPMFEKWAKSSFEHLKIKKDFSVLDVACGPGSVSLLLHDKVKSISAYDFSEEMLNRFEEEIQKQNIQNIKIEKCDCQHLTTKSNSFDLAFSQFGLMFFPNRMLGFQGIYRSLKPGGTAAIYSWAPISDSPAMTMMVSAMQAGFPETKPKKDQEEKSIISGLDNPDVFKTEMETAGFINTSVTPVTHHFPVLGAKVFWERMVKGSAPVKLLQSKMSLSDWQEKEKASIEFLEKNINGVTELSSTAFLGIGHKA